MPSSKEIFEEYYYYVIVVTLAVLAIIYNVHSGPRTISEEMLAEIENNPVSNGRYLAGLDPYISTTETSGQQVLCAEADGRFLRDLAAIRSMAEVADMSILPATYFLIQEDGITEERGLLRSLRQTMPNEKICIWGSK